MSKEKSKIKIAFYDYSDDKVRYITDVVACNKYGRITTRLEVCVDFGYDYIAINKIVNKTLYNIGSKEMAELMTLIDELFEKYYEESEERANEV